MSKSKKMILRILPIVLVLAVVLTCNLLSVSANGVTPGNPDISGTAPGQITKVAGNVWSTVIMLVQILAVAAIIFAGIRYMFASADTKADIKTQTITLVIGAALVFAAGPLSEFVANVAQGIFGGK